MSKHRKDGDPIGSEKPRGKDNSMQKGRYDGSWTNTELRLRDKCLKQFMKNPEGEAGISTAYRESPIWCDSCGQYFKVEGANLCSRCTQ